jgi:hypothetical protein
MFGLFKSKERKETEKRIEEGLKRLERQKAEEIKRRKAASAQRIIEKEAAERKYEDILKQVIFTPESLEAYERRVGYAVEVIDTKERDKGVTFAKFDRKYTLCGNKYLEKHLAESGIEALVDTNSSPHRDRDGDFVLYYYGLPVRRKNGGPYR